MDSYHFFQKRGYRQRSALGLAIIELMVTLGVAGILVAAVSLIVGRGSGIFREQFEQVLITEDARVQLERVSDTVRNARDNPPDDWLVLAEAYQLQIYTNTDDDGEPELVRYELDKSNFRRGVTEAGDTEKIRTLARSVRNLDHAKPVFTYFDADDNQLDPSSATADNVKKIGISFVIDVDIEQAPGPVEVNVVTNVVPRGKLASINNQARLWPVVIRLPQVNPSQATETTPSTHSPTIASTGLALGTAITASWENPQNVASFDFTRATVELSGGEMSSLLLASGFGFRLPLDATVNGIVAEFYKSGGIFGQQKGASDERVSIVKGGNVGTSDRGTTNEWPVLGAYVAHGSSTDLWGETWTASQINADDFGVAIAAQWADSPGSAGIDHIRITVYFSGGTPGQTSGASSDLAEVVTTDPGTGVSTSATVPIKDLGDGRMATFGDSYYTNLNYQGVTIGSFLPDWYTWIGPILVGNDNTQSYFATDQIRVDDLKAGNQCLGPGLSLDTILTACPDRTVSNSGFNRAYKPALTYRQPGGELDYVQNITFDFVPPPPPPAVGCTGQWPSPVGQITFRSKSRTERIDAGSTSVPMPTGTREGDLMIATMTDGFPDTLLTAPAGWTMIQPASLGSDIVRTRAWYKIARAGESGPYTFQITGSSSAGRGYVHLASFYSTGGVNVNGWRLEESSYKYQDSSSKTVSSNSIDGIGTCLLYVSSGSNSRVLFPSSSMTTIFEDDGNVAGAASIYSSGLGTYYANQITSGPITESIAWEGIEGAAPTSAIAAVFTWAPTPPPPSVIVHRSSSRTERIDAGSTSVPMPTGTREGDLMIATMTDGFPDTLLTAPAGWTMIQPASLGSDIVRTRAWYKIARAGESGPYTFQITGSSSAGRGYVHLASFYSTGGVNVNGWRLEESSYKYQDSSSKTVSSNSIDGIGTCLLYVSSGSNSRVLFPSSSMTTIFEDDGNVAGAASIYSSGLGTYYANQITSGPITESIAWEGIEGAAPTSAIAAVFTWAPTPPPSPGVAGPNSPSTGTDGGGGDEPWQNPGNLVSSNDIYTAVNLEADEFSNWLQATGFGFSIPAGATIDGISAAIEGKANGTGTSLEDQRIIVNGSRAGSFPQVFDHSLWLSSDTIRTQGSATEKWGLSWTADAINAACFGWAAQMLSDFKGRTVSIDHVALTVYFTSP